MPRYVLCSMALLLSSSLAAQDIPLTDILVEGKGWTKVDGRFASIVGIAASPKTGEIFVADPKDKKIYRIDAEGGVHPFAECSRPTISPVADDKGNVYAFQPDEGARVVRYDPTGDEQVFGENVVKGMGLLTLDPAGRLWMWGIQFGTGSKNMEMHLICYDTPGKKVATTHLPWAFGPIISAMAIDANSGRVAVAGGPEMIDMFAARIGEDQTLSGVDRYFRPYRRRNARSLRTSSMVFDPTGRLFAATGEGIQVFDPTGRLCGVLASPPLKADPVTVWLAIGGPKADQLYAAFDNVVYVRPIKVK